MKPTHSARLRLEALDDRALPSTTYVVAPGGNDLADFMAGKILSALGFEHDLYPAWTGQPASTR